MSDTEGLTVEQAESRLQDVESDIDTMVANIPDGPGETLDLWRWSQRFCHVMREWQDAYTNVVVAEALAEEDGG